MHRNSELGLTLIELVVVISLIGLLSSVVTGFSTQALRSMNTGQTAQLVQADLRFALSYMTREVMGADSITFTPPSTITYTKAGQAARTFKQVGQTIQRWDNQPLCNYVEHLRFTVQGNILTIELESVTALEGVAEGLPISMRTRVRLRNIQ